MGLLERYENLKQSIKELKGVAVAYSGGVDSTFLIKVAFEVLGDKAVAVTARSSTYPEREYKEACRLIKNIGAKHIIIDSEELDIEGFKNNPPNRCYYCKYELFQKIWKIANDLGLNNVLDGSNYDDIDDYRPGMQAACELKVASPLKDAKLTKEDIRELSKINGLPTWDKPSFACLSSRFPYGQTITEDKLQMVDKAEEYLLGIGFKQLRVRHHGDVARIEVAPDEREKFFYGDLMDTISKKFKEIGFFYTALDLSGYRTGSMNEVILNSKGIGKNE